MASLSNQLARNRLLAIAQDPCFCYEGWRFAGSFRHSPEDPMLDATGCLETDTGYGCFDETGFTQMQCSIVECPEFLVDYGCSCNGGGHPHSSRVSTL